MDWVGSNESQPIPALPRLINRTQELAWLMARLPPQRTTPSFTVLRAPSGYGKTRLTTELAEILRSEGVLAVIVEPQVRAKKYANAVYQGFYTQRCAEALSQQIAKQASNFCAPTFADFLKGEWRERARSTNWARLVRSFPSPKTVYEVGVEVYDRVFGKGDHSANKLLTSDAKEAVETCARYVRQVLSTDVVVLVVHEAQHIDFVSLQLLTELAGPHAKSFAVLEYTLESGSAIDPVFSDLLETASLADDDWLRLVELIRLSKAHLEELLRQTVPGAREISGEYYVHWDGNVRSIRQLRFSASVERGRLGQPLLLDLKSGVIEEYQRQVAALDATTRTILCLLHAHGEATPKAMLPVLLEKLNSLVTRTVVEQCVENLMERELVVAHVNDTLGIENEDLAEAIRTQASLGGVVLLAKKALRDHYWLVLGESEKKGPDVSLAVRQALRLSVDLGDFVTVEKLVEYLSQEACVTTDQAWYVSQIISAIKGGADAFSNQRDRLLLWAAQLAAEIADVKTARDLLRQLSETSAFSNALLCACLVETGDHDEAEHLAGLLAENQDRDTRLAGELIRLALWRCTRRLEAARSLWDELATDAQLRESKLYGYVLRFKELVTDFPECIDALREGVEWFVSRGLGTSAAYTALTLASHLARTGNIEDALTAVDSATRLLAFSTRDQHILLNNEVAVLLLSEAPEPEACCDKLARAIPCSGDDYSDLVLYTNFAVCAALRKRPDLASEAIERAIQVARHPQFADRDVFWGVSFNLTYVNATLQLGRERELAELFGDLKPHSLQNDYWQYRAGHTSWVPDRFEYMLRKPYHPMFLSHWTLDVDGLLALKQESSLGLPGSSNRSA